MSDTEAPPGAVVLEAEGLTKHFPVKARGRAALTRRPRVVHAGRIPSVRRAPRGPS